MASTKVVRLDTFIQKYPQSVRLFLKRRDNVVCRNQTSGKVKTVQFRALFENNRRFWSVHNSWMYYLEAETATEIIEQIQSGLEQSGIPMHEHNQTDPSKETAEEPTGIGANGSPSTESVPSAAPTDTSNFGTTYARYNALDYVQRIGLLEKTEERLTALAEDPDADREEVAEALVESTEQATMINRATLFEALKMGTEEARRYSREMVEVTERMVRSTVRLVDSEVYNDDLICKIVQRSNGTVVQHMTRVFLRGLQFLLYYNRQVIRDGIAAKIRSAFPIRYRNYYTGIVPHIHPDNLSLERVFYGGMKSLSNREIHAYATGFLLHDVGKAEDIEYHEGDHGYDRKIVERHVKIGYRAVMDKTNYPREAALITGHHHEYYGDPSGYGYFREFLQTYKEANSAASQDYVMSYTMEPMIDYEVIAFFPAKALEIVDVFDSLTDPNRRYRVPLEENVALEMMREEFIRKRRKLDPILFDMFLTFYRNER